MNVSVLIPTLDAQPYLAPLLGSLIAQTVEAEIIVVDSSSLDETAAIAQRFGNRVRFLQIPRTSFDHGGTRDFALRQAQGDCICFLTQDALPTDKRYLEKLLSAFDDPDVAAACGRQVARSNAPSYERLTREFNYPAVGRVWRERDIARYGVKAYFFSDVCSAYRRDAYEAVGGFDMPVACNEDMLIAAKLIHAGYALAYMPEASVFHSHTHTLRQEFRRNALIGQTMQAYRDRLVGANAKAEGVKLVRHVSSQLFRERELLQIPVFGAHVGARLLGNQAGKRRGKRS